MLTIEQFTLFNTRARYNITMGLGIYISTCRFTNKEVAFYSLYNFVVEVWKAVPAHHLLKVEATPESKRHLKQFSLETCLN